MPGTASARWSPLAKSETRNAKTSPTATANPEWENCDYVVSGGAARRVVRGGTVPILGVPPSKIIAASGRRIAVALALAPEVEVRNAVTGALVSRFGVDGYVADLALSGTSVLVRVQDEGETRLERHDPTTGELVASIAAPRSLWSLELEGDTVIYDAGRNLGVWRPGSAVTETLWTGNMEKPSRASAATGSSGWSGATTGLSAS